MDWLEKLVDLGISIAGGTTAGLAVYIAIRITEWVERAKAMGKTVMMNPGGPKPSE